MKQRFGIFVMLLVILLLVMVAATYRTSPLSGTAFRPTVLTSADTTLTIPEGYKANQTLLVNDGTGRCYVNFSDTAINTATDFFVEPNESVPLNVPWSKMHLKATTASAEMRIVASY